MPDEVITPAGLAALTAKHCHGDHWDQIPPFRADPEFGVCECGPHPLTQEMADKANALLTAIKAAGGRAPAAVYLHCESNLIFEWDADTPSGFPRVMADWSPGSGWWVWDSVPPADCVFYKPEMFP